MNGACQFDWWYDFKCHDYSNSELLSAGNRSKPMFLQSQLISGSCNWLQQDLLILYNTGSYLLRFHLFLKNTISSISHQGQLVIWYYENICCNLLLLFFQNFIRLEDWIEYISFFQYWKVMILALARTTLIFKSFNFRSRFIFWLHFNVSVVTKIRLIQMERIISCFCKIYFSPSGK